MPDLANNLHRGVHVALARSSMDEAQVARAMAAGELTSPQRYGNSWLFNLRITGTGGSFREAHDEYVWRGPEIYLSQGFLDRCNGLPVILQHPPKEMLDSREYHDRNVGTITYPYIKDDEVWGIARVIDEPAARFMQTHKLSTSPAVIFTPKDGNRQIDVGDGKHLLIEGKPSLLDHLAVCEQGVWDKGGPPTGVDVSDYTSGKRENMAGQRNDSRRADNGDIYEEARHEENNVENRNPNEEERRSDEGDKVDRLLKGIDSIADRMDAFEKKYARRDESEAEKKEEEREEKKEERSDNRRRDDNKRKDATAEEEAKQAEKLHELAEQEERESEEESKGNRGDKKRDDRRHRDDKRADESEEKKEEEREEKKEERSDNRRHMRDDETVEEREKKEMPWKDAARHDGESDRAYSRRADSIAMRYDASLAKRGDESIAAHCDRLADAHDNYRARSDAIRRLNAVDKLTDMVEKIATRMDSMQSRFEDRSDEDEAKFADTRARADSVYEALADHAPRPMRGENLTGYRVRLVRGLQKHSDAWKNSDLAVLARSDSVGFANAESAIYNDAMTAARLPTLVPAGQLHEIRRRTPMGTEIIEFRGDPMVWMSRFMLPGRKAKISRKPGEFNTAAPN